jgi:hypothetical protein
MTTRPKNKNSELVDLLSKSLTWHKARIKFFEKIIYAIIKVQTVCFSRLSEAYEGDVYVESRLRKIQRFFAHFNVSYDLIAKLIYSLLPGEPPYRICLDRTNWKFGKVDINILMISIAWNGIGIPLMWSLLTKRGNSSAQERRQLIKRYLDLFGEDSIDCIMGDREFIGKDWFRYLSNKRIQFYMRIRENMWIHVPRRGRLQAHWLFCYHDYNKIASYNRQVSIDGNKVYLYAIKILNKEKKREYVIIASLKRDPDALLRYKDRWQIETMFKGLKSSGFNIEDTHLTDLSRISKMLAILSVTFVWAYRVGIYRNDHIKRIQIKKHGRQAYSYFKYGLIFIAQALLNPFRVKDFEICTKVLSCT